MYDKFEYDIKNLKGTFAVEDMSVTDKTIKNLKKAAEGKTTYAALIAEARKKYMQRV